MCCSSGGSSLIGDVGTGTAQIYEAQGAPLGSLGNERAKEVTMKILSALISSIVLSLAIASTPPADVTHRQLPINSWIDALEYILSLTQSVSDLFDPNAENPLSQLIDQFNDALDALMAMEGEDDIGLDQVEVSDFPSTAPSDFPSSAPSDYPSSVPSDAPSTMPSDVPSLSPSAAPSVMPSDMPSVIPATWQGASVELPPGYDVCGFSESADFEELNEVQVVYLYRLVLEPGFELATVTRSIEKEIQKAVLEENCMDASTRHRSLARAHGVSPAPFDLPSASCGINCFFMIGRVSLLVDSDTIDEYRGVYCDTLASVREEIIGGLSYVDGVSSTTILNDRPDVPQICNFPQMPDPGLPTTYDTDGEARDGSSTTAIEGLDGYEESDEGTNLWLLVFGFAGVGSAAALLVAIVVRRKRATAREDALAQRDVEAGSSSFDNGTEDYHERKSLNNHSLGVIIDEVPYPSPSDGDSFYTSGAEDEKEELAYENRVSPSSGYMSLPPRTLVSPVSTKSALSVP